MGHWTRCGNTPFYLKKEIGGRRYVNPIDLRHILVAYEFNPEHPGGETEGAASIVAHKMPFHDPTIAMLGRRRILGHKEAGKNQERIDRVVKAWSEEAGEAVDRGITEKNLLGLFANLPPEERDIILDDISYLSEGYLDHRVKKHVQEAGEKEEKSFFFAIEEGSPAALDKDVLEAYEEEAGHPNFIAKTLDDAIDEAMAHLGILEC